jgi:hypothetical protein
MLKGTSMKKPAEFSEAELASLKEMAKKVSQKATDNGKRRVMPAVFFR